jgi:type IV pilus biogenesis protein CpaD/CtpE
MKEIEMKKTVLSLSLAVAVLALVSGCAQKQTWNAEQQRYETRGGD